MELILVYNANSGIKNSVLSSLHKIISPATYPCNLCALTYGNFSEKKLWKGFRERANLQLIFYHKDEFEDIFGKNHLKFPVAVLHENSNFEEVITAKDFKQIKNTQQLIESIQQVIIKHQKA